MDIAVVIELNVLSDWVKQLRDHTELENRLSVLRELELSNGFRRLNEMLGDRSYRLG